MRNIISILLLALTLCAMSCHDDKEETQEIKTTRTVLIYMAGENNLTAQSGIRFLHNDLLEIIEGSKQLADDQRLLVFVDSLNTDSQQASNPYIIEVHGGNTSELYKFDKEFYSSEPVRFKQIVEWAFTNAPAESYGLVLWGHASGWAIDSDVFASRRAYGLDNGSDANDSRGDRWMNIPQMAQMLSESTTRRSAPRNVCVSLRSQWKS